MSTMQNGLVSGNHQNKVGGATGRSRSKFPLSYSQFQTERFAEYFPFFVEEGVSGDVLPLHSNHEVQTYTLKSPILQSLSKKKDYFAVPMQAILPLNWEKFYTQPNIGQDVPDDTGLGVENFWGKIGDLCNGSVTAVTSTLAGTGTLESKLQYLLRFLIFFEKIYSTGSLMETLGISGHNFIRIEYNDQGDVYEVTFDDLFDHFMSGLASALANSNDSIGLNIGGDTYAVVDNPYDSVSGSYIEVTLREALELMRDDEYFTVAGAGTGALATAISNLLQDWTDYTFYFTGTDVPLNIGRLWAYQLVVFHFYSNDHVDYIYSAELFRQYIRELTTRAGSGNTTLFTPTFSVNGYQYSYDSLSAHSFDSTIGGFTRGTPATTNIFGYTTLSTNLDRPDGLPEAIAYFTALFSFKRSLRFLDYFTGARAYALAGGNVSEVAVNSNNAVSIIDLSKQSMMTKFLQAVNRSGRKFSNYMKELFGKTPAYDYHNPMYLAHTSDLVGAQETENTGAAQVSNAIAVTSRLRATSSRYAFEFQPDRDCIVIGLSYYDLPRVYQRATERQNFNVNRFDMFNPYLQFIGDQAIYEAELGTDTPDMTAFGYTNADMQYKQRYNQCNGAFCVPSTGLDNWIFPADMLRRAKLHNISPTFIRSFNSELDRFYQRLTGYALGTYFHFIVRYDNRQDASRPMAYNPVISI